MAFPASATLTSSLPIVHTKTLLLHVSQQCLINFLRLQTSTIPQRSFPPPPEKDLLKIRIIDMLQRFSIHFNSFILQRSLLGLQLPAPWMIRLLAENFSIFFIYVFILFYVFSNGFLFPCQTWPLEVYLPNVLRLTNFEQRIISQRPNTSFCFPSLFLFYKKPHTHIHTYTFLLRLTLFEVR